jgi:hypothetical protein
MRLAVTLICGLAFVGISSQAYPVRIDLCVIDHAPCCEPGTCHCVECGEVLIPSTSATLARSCQLQEVVTVDPLPLSRSWAPFLLTYRPVLPPPKLARV